MSLEVGIERTICLELSPWGIGEPAIEPGSKLVWHRLAWVKVALGLRSSHSVHGERQLKLSVVLIYDLGDMLQ